MPRKRKRARMANNDNIKGDEEIIRAIISEERADYANDQNLIFDDPPMDDAEYGMDDADDVMGYRVGADVFGFPNGDPFFLDPIFFSHKFQLKQYSDSTMSDKRNLLKYFTMKFDVNSTDNIEAPWTRTDLDKIEEFCNPLEYMGSDYNFYLVLEALDDFSLFTWSLVKILKADQKEKDPMKVGISLPEQRRYWFKFPKEFFDALNSKQVYTQGSFKQKTSTYGDVDYSFELDIFLYDHQIHRDYESFMNNLDTINKPIMNLVNFLTDPFKRREDLESELQNFTEEFESDTVPGAFQLRVERFYKCLAVKQKKYLDFDQFNQRVVDCSDLNPVLWGHQNQAIQWMLHREKSDYGPDVSWMFTEKFLGGKRVHYFESLGHFVDENVYQEFCKKSKRSNGGILADEMGLGKTVDVIGLITNNRKPKTDPKYEFFTKETLFRGTEDPLKGDLQCYCGMNPVTVEETKIDREKLLEICLKQNYYINENMIKCLMCGNYQHIQCSSYMIDEDQFPYLCSRCWLTVEPIDSPATLIVCPNSILNQWICELEKHLKSTVKIFRYNGVKSKDYILPPKLAQNDIVITTYDILKTEIDYIHSHNFDHLRNAKRYFSAVSPLLSIVWWRLCFDEAQKVEGSSLSKTVKMANSLKAIYRWAVTGTPIYGTVNELFGLVSFIREEPFNHELVWKQAVHDRCLEFHLGPLLNAMYRCFWRTEMKTVLDSLKLRKPIVHDEFVDFSQIERDFYLKKSLDCRRLIQQKLNKFDSFMKIKDLSHSVQRAIIDAALTLRQICCHPQMGFSQKFVDYCSLEDVLDKMIEECRYDGEKSHREMIAAMNGMAAVYLLHHNYKLAIETYRKSLNSIDGMKDIRTDKTQKYHIYYNLAMVMDALDCQQVDCNGEPYPPFNGSQPVIISTEAVNEIKTAGCIDPETDKLWRLKAKQLYDSYLNSARLSAITSDKYRLEIVKRCETAWKELKLENLWFVYALKELATMMSPRELSLSIGDLFGLTDDLGGPPSSVNYFIIKLMDFWSRFETLRREIIDCFSKNLNHESVQENAPAIIQCHVGLSSGIRRDCHLCQAQAKINEFEEVIFRSVRKLNTDDDAERSTEDNEREENRFLETNWNESNQLVSLRRIGAIFKARAHQAADYMAVSQEIDRFLVFVEECKKEYKAHRKCWIEWSEFVLRIDELNQAQTRYSSDFTSEDRLNRDLEIRNKSADQLVIDEGRLRYLKNLKKKALENNPETRICIVCDSDLVHYGVLTCGHITCVKCLIGLRKAAQGSGNSIPNLRCPICRAFFSPTKINYVDSSLKIDPEISVKGKWSTKMVHVIRTVKKILESNEKILIFSSWIMMLDLMAKALKMNEIESIMIDGRNNFSERIDSFKRSENVNVLLLLTSLACEGLNLTEASHVIFINSLLKGSEEMQAVGRVYRLGQTRQTHVYKFIVKDTVEQLIEGQKMDVLHRTAGNEFTNMTVKEFCSLFQVYDGYNFRVSYENDIQEYD